MPKPLTIASILAAVLALGEAASAGGDSMTESGRRLAEQLCARCHAIGTTGESPFPPAPTFPAIADKYPPENLAESLAEGIAVGHDAMPEFALTPAQIDSFIAYLQSLE